MGDVALVTDSCCDLSADVIADAGVEFVPLSYIMDDVEYPDDLGQSVPYEEFYRQLEAGAAIKTAQVPVIRFLEAFDRYYNQGRPVIYIALSSAISGTFDAAVMARRQFLSEHPEARIQCMDSKCASTGQGLLVLEAARLANAGANFDEVVSWVESSVLFVNHIFTVDSFEHLVRGGRVSPAVGMAGSILDIKPVMLMDPNGALAVVKKPRGRHKAIELIAEMAAERVTDPHRPAFVSHGDCAEDAERLRTLLVRTCGLTDVRVGRVGSVIGAHTGPGVLSAFFWGQPRA